LGSFSSGHGLAAPQFTEVLQSSYSSHDLVEEISGDCSFGKAIRAHVTSVDPDYGFENAIVKEFTNVLYVDK
jgi:hypothetical protein